MADAKISALTDGGGLKAGDALAVARSSTSFRASPIGVPVLVYRYTVAGSDKASIDTGVDTADAGSNDWTNGDLLEIFILARTDDTSVAPAVDIVLNNDTSAIYDRQNLTGANATASASSAVAESAWRMNCHGGSGSTGYASAIALRIPDFTGTTFWKTAFYEQALADQTAANQQVNVRSFGYRSTSAITRLSLAPETAGKKLKVGSQLLIYKRLSS